MNWQNDDHVDTLAQAWNVEPLQIPHWAPPTHAMQIFRQCENGSIRFLWVSGTNPAVSLPELARIRSIYEDNRLFLVVSDAFMTETAHLADLVLPTALWGEKTGCFTNPDRTVHLSEKAVDPPGEARSDFDIFCDYARRMGLEDKEGQPLVPWTSPEEAWNAFRVLTKNRPLDQSALSYDKLRDSAGVQWPCNEEHPDGTARLYVDHHFPTDANFCESYGHDLFTGATNEPDEYRAHDPAGRAFLKGARYVPPNEPVDDEYPLILTTGRTVYHFHTRTKTARAPELDAAAPGMWIEVSVADADRYGLSDGDLVEVRSRRGSIEAPVRISGSRAGTVFAPFQFGYFDDPANERDHSRAANELTRTEWDPVSKQPLFKIAAVQIIKRADAAAPSAAPTTAATAPSADPKAATPGNRDAARVL